MSYLAIDIGASSGRHMLGKRVNGKIELTEVYRFKNGPKMKNGHLCWDHEQLFSDIIAGMKKCKEIISLKEKTKNSDRMKDIVEANSSRIVPKWLDMDKNTLTAKVVRLAEREDIDFEVAEHLIVELYSK